MAALALALVLMTLATMAHGGIYTVTEEVWFEVEVKDLDGPGEHYKGRFVVAVFGEAAPMTSLNFISLARGYFKKRGKSLTYKGTPVHRIVPDFVVQMGDVTKGDGSGGMSIYGPTFNDEEFLLSHRSPGWVAMANHGPDTNGSQFYIMLSRARWLDRKHVVFGKVISGFSVVDVLGNLESDESSAVPTKNITITDCGVSDITRKYDLKEDQLDITEDL